MQNTQLKVLSVNTSLQKGTIKKPVETIELFSEGVKGDAHAAKGNRQVSMLGTESINKFTEQNSRVISFGEFAENITTSGLLLYKTHPLDRFICGNVVLEVTQIGKECHGTSCTIFREVGNCVMPKEGIFCRVVGQGMLKAGDIIEYEPRIFRMLVITLSDRASAGDYEDRSGPRVSELLTEHLNNLELKFTSEYKLIPDDPHLLKEILLKASADNIDFIFTTGGTGIGPKDITPDVIKPLLDKEIPGIMEMIRLKYGSEKPNALVSRSIAGVKGNSLIFALPGSVKAVNEYIAEIKRSLMHLVYMLHGLDQH